MKKLSKYLLATLIALLCLAAFAACSCDYIPPEPKPCTVSFETYGGEGEAEDITATVGKLYGVLPSPTKTGYNFKGWWTEENGTGKEITADTIVANAHDHTLYAKWSKFTQGLSYTLINGDTEYAVSGIGTATDTDIIIPDIFEGKPVTVIGKNAFENCDHLTSVVIEDGVIIISDFAFFFCYSLKSVIIGGSVTSIGDSAFESCTSLESVIIPDSVTTIGNFAFYECFSLESVIIGDSVTTIGNCAFSYCYSLKSIIIPDSVTSIGNSAFVACSSLKSVIIGGSVTSIGNGVFSYCDSLESIIIPNSVIIIGVLAFAYCDSLTIYCEAESQPAGWDSIWYYPNYYPVVWGYVEPLIPQ